MSSRIEALVGAVEQIYQNELAVSTASARADHAAVTIPHLMGLAL